MDIWSSLKCSCILYVCMDIVIATKNRGKIKEIRDALNRIDIKVLSLDEIGLHIEIEEDGGTYSENAVKKAVEVAKRTGKTALSDDSGLEIDALDGRPGINSSRFAGDNADDRERNLKVLEMMKDVPPEKRGARFKCVIAIATPTFPPTFNKGGGMRGLYKKRRYHLRHDGRSGTGRRPPAAKAAGGYLFPETFWGFMKTRRNQPPRPPA